MQQSAAASIPMMSRSRCCCATEAPPTPSPPAAADHDLVVMGTHGRGRIGEALAGSVSRAVVHSLHAPVLITRAPGWRRRYECLVSAAALAAEPAGVPARLRKDAARNRAAILTAARELFAQRPRRPNV